MRGSSPRMTILNLRKIDQLIVAPPSITID